MPSLTDIQLMIGMILMFIGLMIGSYVLVSSGSLTRTRVRLVNGLAVFFYMFGAVIVVVIVLQT